MRRFRKILIWFISITIFLFVLLFVAASVYISSYKSNLEKVLTENIGLETKIDGKLSLKVMPGISFVANKLKVISNETYVLKIEQTEISIDYTSLFSSNIDINALRFVDPQVYIVRDSSGKFNFEDVNQQYVAAEEADIHHLNLSDFSISNGRLLYVDMQYGDTLMIDGFYLKSDEIGITGTANKIDVDKINLRGLANIGEFKLNMLKVDSMQFNIDGRAGKIAIVAVDLGYFDGTSNGKAILDFTKTPDQITIEHKMTGMNLKQFGESIGNDLFVSGQLDYNLKISFNSFHWEETKQSINGAVSISGENLAIQGVDMDDILDKFKSSQQFNAVDLGAVFLAGPYGAVFTKGINLAQLLSSKPGDTTQIKKLVSNWSIKNGLSVAKDVAFSTRNYRLAMTGSLDFKDDMYKDVSISLLNKNGCAAISQTINGPFTEPETMSINAFGAVTGPVDNLWKNLTKPLRRPCTPVYNGSVEHPM